MSYQIHSKTLALCLGVLAVAFSMGYLVLAWTEPTSTPPGGNVPPPINTGDTSQLKKGALSVYGVFDARGGSNATTLIVANGKVGIGTSSPANILEVKGKALVTDDVCLANGICLSNCSATACPGDCSEYAPIPGCHAKAAGEYSLQYCQKCDGTYTTHKFYPAGVQDLVGPAYCNGAHMACDGSGGCVPSPYCPQAVFMYNMWDTCWNACYTSTNFPGGCLDMCFNRWDEFGRAYTVCAGTCNPSQVCNLTNNDCYCMCGAYCW